MVYEVMQIFFSFIQKNLSPLLLRGMMFSDLCMHISNKNIRIHFSTSNMN